MSRAVLVGLGALMLAACFQPDFPRNLSCSSEGTCPPGQFCDVGRCIPDGTERFDAGIVIDGGAGLPCQLYPQNGCPAGFKCAATGAPDQGECRPDGFTGLGGKCSVDVTGNDGCQAGLVCVYDECVAFCAGESCPGSHACIDVTAYDICLPRCNALTQDCPMTVGGVAQACFLGSGAAACEVPERFVPEGIACMAFNDCQPGLSCHVGFCRRHCDYSLYPNMQGTCSAGQNCTFSVPPYGVCQ